MTRRNEITAGLMALGFTFRTSTADGDGQLWADEEGHLLVLSSPPGAPEQPCRWTDDFGGHCVYGEGHLERGTVHRFEGGDEEARHATAVLAYRAERTDRALLGGEAGARSAGQQFGRAARRVILQEHLQARHGFTFGPGVNEDLDTLESNHEHEHDGPGTIRHHPREDLTH